MKKIDIVLPVFHEEESIDKFHECLNATLVKLINYQFRIIYVLDKSTDKSEEKIKMICEKHDNVTLISLSTRFGYQNSFIAGLDHCSGDAVIMMDADLEHPPEIIPCMLEKFEEGFDVVSTKRTYKKERPLLKRISSKYFYKFLRFISNTKISSDSDEFKLMSKKVLHIFQKNIKEQNLFLRGLIDWVGFKTISIPFFSPQRPYGESKFNLKQLMRLAFHGVVSFSKVPLTLAVICGTVVSLISFLYGFYIVIHRIVVDNSSPPGWTETIVIVLFIGGLQLVFMGIIGQYVGAIFDEVKNRPRYIVEDIYGKK